MTAPGPRWRPLPPWGGCGHARRASSASSWIEPERPRCRRKDADDTDARARPHGRFGTGRDGVCRFVHGGGLSGSRIVGGFVAGIVLAGIVLAGIVLAGIVVAGIVLAGIVVAGIVLAGIVLAGIVLAGIVVWRVLVWADSCKATGSAREGSHHDRRRPGPMGRWGWEAPGLR